MSYRRPAGTDVATSRWRLKNQSLLHECGIPMEVAGSDRRWLYTLLHGDDELDTGWNPNWISPRQAAKLLGKLQSETYEPDPGYFWLLQALSDRAGEDD